MAELDPKFVALMHYVIESCPDPKALGATRLNKILWYSDVWAYMRLGKSITSERHVKRPFGPCPERAPEAQAKLVAEGAIAVREKGTDPYSVREFFSLRPPDLSGFSPEEISLVDTVIRKVCDQPGASAVSDLSHNAAWRATEIGEEIPLHAMFVAEPGQLDVEDFDWARSVIDKFAA